MRPRRALERLHHQQVAGGDAQAPGGGGARLQRLGVSCDGEQRGPLHGVCLARHRGDDVRELGELADQARRVRQRGSMSARIGSARIGFFPELSLRVILSARRVSRARRAVQRGEEQPLERVREARLPGGGARRRERGVPLAAAEQVAQRAGKHRLRRRRRREPGAKKRRRELRVAEASAKKPLRAPRHRRHAARAQAHAQGVRLAVELELRVLCAVRGRQPGRERVGKGHVPRARALGAVRPEGPARVARRRRRARRARHPEPLYAFARQPRDAPVARATAHVHAASAPPARHTSASSAPGRTSSAEWTSSALTTSS